MQAADFTDLERLVLDLVAQQMGEDRATFEKQVAAAHVIEREHTVVGFYTTVRVDPAQAEAIARLIGEAGRWVNGGGAVFEVADVVHGVGGIVWFRDGYFDCIEGYTHGDDLNPDLFSLQVVSVLSNR